MEIANTSGIKRKRCPHCGGRIIVSDFFMFSKYYGINKNTGRVSWRQCGKSDSGAIGTMTANCENFPDHCGVNWEGDEFYLGHNDEFIDLKYGTEPWE